MAAAAVPRVTKPVFETSEFPGKLSIRADARDFGSVDGVVEEKRSLHIHSCQHSTICSSLLAGMKDIRTRSEQEQQPSGQRGQRRAGESAEPSTLQAFSIPASDPFAVDGMERIRPPQCGRNFMQAANTVKEQPDIMANPT